eukprot:9754583-Ditylum_brightwellii.AAC.1
MSTQQDSTHQLLCDMQTNFDMQLQSFMGSIQYVAQSYTKQHTEIQNIHANLVIDPRVPYNKQQKQGYEKVAHAEVMKNTDALCHTRGPLTTSGGGG